MKPIITSAVIAVGVALCFSAPSLLSKEKEHEEESVSQSNIPAAVRKLPTRTQKAASVHWEKEGANYEVVIEKNGKRVGRQMDANGKVLSKHEESKRKGEKY